MCYLVCVVYPQDQIPLRGCRVMPIGSVWRKSVIEEFGIISNKYSCYVFGQIFLLCVLSKAATCTTAFRNEEGARRMVITLLHIDYTVLPLISASL